MIRKLKPKAKRNGLPNVFEIEKAEEKRKKKYREIEFSFKAVTQIYNQLS